MPSKHLKTRSPQSGTNATPLSSVDVPAIVKGVIDDIRRNGDSAVATYSAKFDKWERPSFKLSASEIADVIATVDNQIIEDIKTVQANVRRFAQAQRDSLKDFEVEMQPGVFLGQKNVPIQNVGA
jgi:histidinol dehydrogenase